jgi:hypothetical protein
VQPATSDVAAFAAGFVAAEGSFVTGERRFRFSVGLGRIDCGACEALRELFGCGSIVDSPRRKPHYDDESSFVIQSLRQLIDVVVPFMDEHLPPSYKRRQYLEWRTRLFDYWEHKAKRVRPCTVDECEKPRRAHGLCRHHLYVQYRK